MAGNPVSKTGLIASPKKRLSRVQKSNDVLHLSKCAYARPVQFSLRPFGGLFNPYAKGCSILCNHPGPNEVKNVVRQAKDAWISEGKGLLTRDEHQHHLRHLGIDGEIVNGDEDLPDNIPEEFFRRYTGSDSRPMTPTPTVASGRTRTSTGSHINTRRCFTPDLINSGAKERKQIILDLRRSHSQETMYWNASSELSPAVTDSQLKSASKNKNLKACEQTIRNKSAEKKTQLDGKSSKPSSATEALTAVEICANDQEEVEDEEDVPRRRGKRKKKASKLQTTSTFQVSQEPETQIATLGPDSPNQSNRPSLIPNDTNIPRLSLVTTNQGTGQTEPCRQSSFISEEALKYLRRGLNINVVENSFDRYMNKALKEALRTIPAEKVNNESEALRKFKETMPVTTVDNERWLSMPRKYTRNSVRFTLPINTHDLAVLTPFQYVSRHIWLSNYRKQLCHYVFTKFLPEINEQDAAKAAKTESTIDPDQRQSIVDTERTISFQDLQAALRDVLGFHGTDDKINEIKAILQLTAAEHGQLNFRSWCGVVAFSERYLNGLSHEEDPCDEIEMADFESLERKFSYVDVSEALKVVLNMIKHK